MNAGARALLGAFASIVAMGWAMRARPRAAAEDGPPVLMDTAGPKTRARPEGAVEANDAATLTRLLADPHGPSVVWIPAVELVGEFVLARPVAVIGALGATLVGTGRGSVVTIDAAGASLENVYVRHSGQRNTLEDAGIRAKGKDIHIADVDVRDALFGISLAGCERCTLEGARVRGSGEGPDSLQGDGIKLWESHGSSVRRCVVEDSRDVVVWYTRHATLEDNVVRRSRYGTHFMYAHDAVVRNSRFLDDVVGVFAMYSTRVRT
ncbi:MAG: NosD domain-containing protein, partial [Polyangiales bacterium]